MGSPTYGPLNKRFTLTGIFLSSFFFHSLFPFSQVFDCSPSGLNLNLTAFRRHSQATHPEEAPCWGVPIASGPFPVKILGALCCSCLLTCLFPILLHWEDNELSNYILFIDKAPMSRTGLAYSRHGPPLQYSCLENPMDGGACRLQSMRSLRVRHYWGTLLSLFTFMHGRRKWQPTKCLFF